MSFNLDNLRLATEEENDDLYSGFNEYNPMYDTANLAEDEGFMNAVKTSHGRRPPMTALRGANPVLGRNAIPPPSSFGRPVTGAVADGSARPMTSVAGAGFSSNLGKGAAFDPLSQAGKDRPGGIAPPLDPLSENGPEEKVKALEKRVGELIEESVVAQSKGNLTLALDKAKDAGRKERALVRQREQSGLSENINLDLTYSVLFNLAVQYEANEMFPEALNTYNVVVKNKMFSNAGRLKVNMGNIYFNQGQYMKAIKFYRMALDQVPNTHKDMRIHIMQNIGAVFLKMGQYNEAATSYEHIMTEKPNFRTGFNLILCYFALGDSDKMKKAFQKLLSVNLGIDDEDKYTTNPENTQESVYLDAIKNDLLRQAERKQRSTAEWTILSAAKVIAPAVENTFAAGFDWCIDQVKNSPCLDLANDLEIHKALMYLKERDFPQAVQILKTFEKKETQVKCQAATNLSFIYYLQGNLADARRYADIATKADRFNAPSLTNMANCLLSEGDVSGAETLYKEALENDSSCHEALFNLGLLYKQRQRLDESLDCFLKLHNIMRHDSQVMYHIASLYEHMEDWSQAQEWLMQCVGIASTDPSILSHLAKICEKDDTNADLSQAFQYRYDAYRLFPADIETLDWLGGYYIQSQFYEKAVRYYSRAAVIQPKEVKWQLMVASCYRRSGNYQLAFEKYKSIHNQFPDNVECLKFINRLCVDLGLQNELQEYANKLKKAEKSKEMREQRASSGGRRGGSGRGDRTPASANSSDGNLHNGSAGSGSAKRRTLPEADGYSTTKRDIDSSYVDPLGPAPERPKTAARQRQEIADEFDDVEVDDDLLPV
ncbi:intraflagellar transport protein 88 homolog [Styela clava]